MVTFWLIAVCSFCAGIWTAVGAMFLGRAIGRRR